MMEVELSRLIQQEVPALNPVIANGLAVTHFKGVEAYVDSNFRAVAKGFPEHVEGLTYVKGERCDPQIEYNELTKPRAGGKRYYDVATSYLFMMVYTFNYKGETIRRYLSLPYVNDAGEIYLGGSRFVISPVLADRVMSIDRTSIFIRFNRGKVTFERAGGAYRANGLIEKVYVVYGRLWNRPAVPGEPKPENKGKTTLVHYLFCKYGVRETFKRFADVVPEFGTPDEINEKTHPNEEWVICESSGVTPEGVPNKKTWRPDHIRVAVRREHYTETMRNYIAGFFYVVDHFPNRVATKFLDHVGIWRILMGELLFGSQMGHGHLQDKVSDHIASLDEYIDEIMRKKFAEIGVTLNDIYEFFAKLIACFTEWLLDAADRINSLYYKELNVLYYAMEDITNMINIFYFKLVALAKSKRLAERELKLEDIVGLMDKYLKPGKIYAIRKGHPEVTTASSSGDNKAFKITSIMVPQDKASRHASHSDSGAMTDEAKRLHFSLAEIGGYANMPKSDPSGHSRINLYAHMDAKGVMVPNPELAELRESVGEKIRRLT